MVVSLANMVRHDGNRKVWDITRELEIAFETESYAYVAGYWCYFHNRHWRPQGISPERLGAWELGFKDAEGDANAS